MHAEQRPPTAGIVAAVAYLVVVFAPYLLLPDAEAAGLPVYYDYGVAGPQYLSLLAVVAVVLFAAGREARTEPDFAAGILLVLGFVLALLVTLWAVLVPADVVLGLGEATWLEYHRWLAVVTAVGVFLAAGWYARVLGLL